MNTCEDCGTRIYSGICPNCHEELYIETTQGEYIEGPSSDEWNQKVEAQRQEVRQKAQRDSEAI
jgi:hypothetical protein